MNLPCPAARAVPRLPVGSEARASAGTHASAARDASRRYQELRDEGVVELRPGRGAVVTQAAPRIAGPVAALRAFVAGARRVGLTPTEAAAMVREEMSS